MYLPVPLTKLCNRSRARRKRELPAAYALAALCYALPGTAIDKLGNIRWSMVQRFGACVLTTLGLLCLGVCLAGAADPQSNYPNRPIRLLVGFTAGTAPDVGARILADKLAEALGKSVVV